MGHIADVMTGKETATLVRIANEKSCNLRPILRAAIEAFFDDDKKNNERLTLVWQDEVIKVAYYGPDEQRGGSEPEPTPAPEQRLDFAISSIKNALHEAHAAIYEMGEVDEGYCAKLNALGSAFNAMLDDADSSTEGCCGCCGGDEDDPGECSDDDCLSDFCDPVCPHHQQSTDDDEESADDYDADDDDGADKIRRIGDICHVLADLFDLLGGDVRP